MTLRDAKSIIIISTYLIVNGLIVVSSLLLAPDKELATNAIKSVAPEFTEIEKLDYFHLKSETPQMSLAAEKMKSQGEEIAEFETPRGVYHVQEKRERLNIRPIVEFIRRKKNYSLSLEKWR